MACVKSSFDKSDASTLICFNLELIFKFEFEIELTTEIFEEAGSTSIERSEYVFEFDKFETEFEIKFEFEIEFETMFEFEIEFETMFEFEIMFKLFDVSYDSPIDSPQNAT